MRNGNRNRILLRFCALFIFGLLLSLPGCNTDYIEAHPYDALDAAQSGDTATFKKLLACDTDIDTSIPGEHHSRNCLMEAACYGHKDIVKLLLQKQVSLSGKDAEGRTALDLAKMNRHFNIVELLQKAEKERQQEPQTP